jgi:N-acetylmuramoyl-L-alanine amidase CwlA
MAKTVSTGFIADKINGIKVNSGIACNSGNLNNNASRSVAYIVMHYTGNPKDTAKANATYFSSGGRNASAHFFVDDSEIYQSVELRDTAWHCGAKTYYHNTCRNANSIGIEMCCTAGNYKISEKTKKNAAHLCAFICKMLGISASGVDTYVLRHYDVTHKSCPAQMVDNSGEWVDFKSTVKSLLGGNATQSSTTTKAKTTQAGGYLVRIKTDVLNVRKGAGNNFEIATTVKKGEVYTIVEEVKDGSITWGRLKSGAGYISLGDTEKA